MKKQKIFSLAGLACYAIFLIVGVMFIFGMFNVSDSADGSVGDAIAAIFAIILASAGIIYAAISIFPIVFKLASITRGNMIFSILCIPFDLVYVAINAALAYGSLTAGTAEAFGIVIFILLTAVSLAALAFNIVSIVLSVKALKYPQG